MFSLELHDGHIKILNIFKIDEWNDDVIKLNHSLIQFELI